MLEALKGWDLGLLYGAWTIDQRWFSRSETLAGREGATCVVAPGFQPL